MSRGTTIAAVAAATGALVAASVFSVVAISSTATSEELPGAKAAVPVAATDTLPATGDASVISADDLQPASSDEDLVVPTVDTALPGAAAGATSTQTIATRTATRPTRPDVGEARAKALVLKAAPGRVEGVSTTKRGGYSAYAVKVQRADGSMVIGYVDRATGVVFDWTKVSGATGSAPTGTSSRGTSTGSHEDSDSDEAADDSRESASDEDSQNDDNGRYEGDDHESGDHESDGSDD